MQRFHTETAAQRKKAFIDEEHRGKLLAGAREMKASKAAWDVGALSDRGHVRTENQDREISAQLRLGNLYIVADGMGGHEGGAAAARLTVEGLQRYLEDTPPNWPVEDAIRAAFEKTNRNVYDQAHSCNPETQGMGSTAVLLLTSGRIARVAHVGDSRAYLYRDERLFQLTTDHTEVQKMVDAGMLTHEEARNHPLVSVLDRAIGNRSDVEVDIAPPLLLEEGDAILLCSDGLCGYADDSEMEAALSTSRTAGEAANRLIGLALEKGGEDNVTVQFIRYDTHTDAHRKSKPVLYGLFAAILGAALLAGFLATSITEENPAEKNVPEPDNTSTDLPLRVTLPSHTGLEAGQKAPQKAQGTEKGLQNHNPCSEDKDQPCNPAVDQDAPEEMDRPDDSLYE